MKIVFASRTGNVETLIGKLGISDAIRISDGSESVDEDYILFTYTDGYGDVPVEVDTFLQSNSAHLKGVIASGDTAYGEAFCGSGDKISETYGVPCLYKVENDGTDDDVSKIRALIA